MIVVDWGTTNLRVFACSSDGTILHRAQSTQGIKVVPVGGFPSVLASMIKKLGVSSALPVFVCGMAGARGGWHEAPYCQAPLALQDIAANLTPLPDGLNGYLLPGAKAVCADGTSDVMRGEEIQIFGGMSRLGIRDAVLCLPGTHSKWVRVRAGRIVGFATFMTGDIFQALSHTILASDAEAADDPEAFGLGLAASADADYGLLHRLFSARTRVLDNALRPDQMSSYVSGLLIGHELAESASFREPGEAVVLIGAETLCSRYREALLHFGTECLLLESSDAACSGVAALCQLLQGAR
ncbi:MAG: 2-dehydro-3-deoxygalactonokinase [Desulfuromonadales bacterium]